MNKNQRAASKARQRRAEHFEGKLCAICSSAESLEIDHIDPSTKDPALAHNSSHLWYWSEERRAKELLKCQILCKPCHIRKTNREGSNTRNIARGSDRGHAKLSDDDVRGIRSLKGQMSQEAIAQIYGVGSSTIGSILRGERWTHVVT